MFFKSKKLISLLPEIAVLVVIFATGVPAQAGNNRMTSLMSGQYQASAVVADRLRAFAIVAEVQAPDAL